MKVTKNIIYLNRVRKEYIEYISDSGFTVAQLISLLNLECPNKNIPIYSFDGVPTNSIIISGKDVIIGGHYSDRVYRKESSIIELDV